jgi:glycosyltransferase involved in cell wall biosynthesis
MKVLFFGTHPKQFNGYSKVVYELMKVLNLRKDIEFGVYGFQKFYDNAQHRKDVPSNMFVYDAFANESPKESGFGVKQVKDFVMSYKPDICVVYNDMLVIHQVVTQIKAAQNDGLQTKICAYIDQVYLNQKKEFIDFVNKNCDFALMFTEFWEKNIIEQGITLPSDFLPHGFNKMTHFPIPKQFTRQYYGLNQDDFIILNLNRNQPRKRWDICIKAFAEIVSRYPKEPIKLMIATAVQGAWNLLEIFERELKKRNLSLEDGMKHLIMIENPQQLTDDETNVLYNVADIGINTCDGEGFGLCQFEEAAIGIPQVVPRLGGFIEFFDDSCAMLAEPKIAYYVDNTRDAVCGEALLCDYTDYVEGIETYYLSKEVRLKHGQKCRDNILKNYTWEKVADKFVGIMTRIHALGNVPPQPPPTQLDKEIAHLNEEVEKIDIEALGKMKNIRQEEKFEQSDQGLLADLSVPTSIPTTPDTSELAQQIASKKKKLKKKKLQEELYELKQKLDTLTKGLIEK